MDRRTFTKSLASGAALMGTSVSLSAVADSLDSASCEALGMTCGDFENLSGESFSIDDHSGHLKLVKTEAGSKTAAHLQYFLRFEQSAELDLPEDIYQLTASNGKKMALLLSPSHTEGGIMEAVINLQTQPTV